MKPIILLKVKEETDVHLKLIGCFKERDHLLKFPKIDVDKILSIKIVSMKLVAPFSIYAMLLIILPNFTAFSNTHIRYIF